MFGRVLNKPLESLLFMKWCNFNNASNMISVWKNDLNEYIMRIKNWNSYLLTEVILFDAIH